MIFVVFVLLALTYVQSSFYIYICSFFTKSDYYSVVLQFQKIEDDI